MSTFHVYIHEDTDEDHIEKCKVCELTTEDKNDEFVIPQPLGITKPVFSTVAYKSPVFYDLVLRPSSYLYTNIFGRPPPQVS